MVFSGWFATPITGFTPPTPPAADDLDNIPVPKKKEDPKLNPYRGYEYIDVELIDLILKDDNGIELAWLEELLKSGVRVRNITGRYLKSDRFITRIRAARAFH